MDSNKQEEVEQLVKDEDDKLQEVSPFDEQGKSTGADKERKTEIIEEKTDEEDKAALVEEKRDDEKDQEKLQRENFDTNDDCCCGVIPGRLKGLWRFIKEKCCCCC